MWEPEREVVAMALQLMNLDPALDAAEHLLARACVARHSLTIPRVPVYLRPRLGITGMAPFTLAEARLFGFDLRNHDAEVESLLTIELRRRSERLDEVLFGSGSREIVGPLGSRTSADGCLSRARRQVYGSVGTYLDVTWFINEVRYHQQGWTDNARAKAAAHEYLSCMSVRGYQLSSFGEVYEFAGRQFGTQPAVTRPEREMAVAVAECQRTSRVWPTWDSLALELVGPWLENERTRMANLIVKADAAAVRARAILGSDWQPSTP